MNEKFEDHLNRYKTLYISGACLLGGVLIGVAIKSKPSVTNVSAVASPVTNVVTNVSSHAGYAHKIVECVETGDIWKTVKEAAHAAGVEPSTMSKHLNGAKDHVKDLHYKIVGVAAGA